MVIRYGDLYLQVRKELLATEDAQSAAMIARDVVCTISGKSHAEFLAQKDSPVEPEVVGQIEEAIRKIIRGEPLAYVLGQWEFYGLPLYVTKDVLIPRDDTCAVAELAINKCLFLESDPRVLDLCCGSGCIGIAIASRVKDARVTLADISKEALAVAKKNIARHRLGGRMTSVQADARMPASKFLGKFDLIVSNPPYVTEAEMKELPHSVADFEPHLALFGGEDGLDFYRDIVKNFSGSLKPGGYLCFEFGMNQGDAVCRILEENDFVVLERKPDFNGRERAVLAQYGGKG